MIYRWRSKGEGMTEQGSKNDAYSSYKVSPGRIQLQNLILDEIAIKLGRIWS